MTSTPVAPRVGRLASLDGLRGLASLMVVFTHSRLATDVPNPSSPDQIRDSWLRGGFLGVVGDGATAVAIFFILSGIVLTLPFLRERSLLPWLAYYPRRLARIYLPVWASIGLALVWYFAVPRRTDPTLPPWIADHIANFGLGTTVRALALVQTTNLNTPLWSLHWEILFSLALPLFVLLVRPRTTLWLILLAAAAMACILAGAATGSGELLFLPQFGLGAIIGSRVTDIKDWLERAPLRIRVAIGLTTLGTLLGTSFAETTAMGSVVVWTLRMVASVGAVLMFLSFRTAQRVSTTTVVQWLGRISFSLYLVHEPLIVSLRLLHEFSYWQMLAVAIPSALLLSQLFYWVAEKPAHLFSRSIGRLIERRLGGRGAPRMSPGPSS